MNTPIEDFGAQYPCKSGLMNKHTVKHTISNVKHIVKHTVNTSKIHERTPAFGMHPVPIQYRYRYCGTADEKVTSMVVSCTAVLSLFVTWLVGWLVGWLMESL